MVGGRREAGDVSAASTSPIVWAGERFPRRRRKGRQRRGEVAFYCCGLSVNVSFSFLSSGRGMNLGWKLGGILDERA